MIVCGSRVISERGHCIKTCVRAIIIVPFSLFVSFCLICLCSQVILSLSCSWSNLFFCVLVKVRLRCVCVCVAAFRTEVFLKSAFHHRSWVWTLTMLKEMFYQGMWSQGLGVNNILFWRSQICFSLSLCVCVCVCAPTVCVYISSLSVCSEYHAEPFFRFCLFFPQECLLISEASLEKLLCWLGVGVCMHVANNLPVTWRLKLDKSCNFYLTFLCKH